jgi:hypothetical protein
MDRFKEQTIREIAAFINIEKSDLILKTSQKELDRMIKLWYKDEIIEIHHMAYGLK